MKKTLLSLLALVFAGHLSAQTLQFDRLDHSYNVTEENIQPGRYEIVGNLNEFYELTFDINVTNLTDAPLSIKCEKIVIAENTAGMNFFCWGTCWGPEINEYTVEIQPNEKETFNAHWQAVNENWEPLQPGVETTVEYHFSAENGEHYIFEIYFKYEEENVADFNNVETFSNAYPNPANNIVSFDHNMPLNTQSASVAIYNMMGQEVIRQDINLGSSRTDVNVSDLTNGVYFYSLIVNNKSVKTNKLVISK